MSVEIPLQLRWPTVVAGAVTFAALGAIGTYVMVRPDSRAMANGHPPTPPSTSQPAAMTPDADRGMLPDITIALSGEAVKRAGIVVAGVESRPLVTTLRLPAIVEPNAYKQVSVTPLVPGRIASVNVVLGAHVRKGETMAIVFSPELADAQARFMAANAMLDAHERELARTEKLVQIGSASRQELERIHAEHTAQLTVIESARSRLALLGMTAEAIDRLTSGKAISANTDIPAPMTGVVTERIANPGLNVESSAKLFTVVDLSTVWIVANLYERDFSRVRVGDRATVVSSAYPGLKLQGAISYVDPRINPDTRTAQVRIEIPNPRQELRLGMLADVEVETAGRTAGTLVPKNAVQNIDERSFVYIPTGTPTQFIEREVQLGARSGEQVQVSSGLQPGDRVVTDGSFLLRAERERLGLRASSSRDR